MRRKIILVFAGFVLLACALFVVLLLLWQHDPLDATDGQVGRDSEIAQRSKATGPLRQHGSNPRYFANASGNPVYLTGSHAWNNFQEKSDWPSREFDYAGYLRLLRKQNHNFIRLWVWEQFAGDWNSEKVEFDPIAYLRTGPGMALDGNPRVDLAQFNQAYFDRLRSRVRDAADQGIYVSVMLFQGWSVGKKPDHPGNPWLGHPFNRENNINEVDGDLDGNGEGKEIHTLANPAILALQERYVAKVIDTLNDCDNLLWEIGNEFEPDSRDWQYHIINYIKRYESAREKQHPVGMTSIFPNGQNSDLFKSPADWVSPNADSGDYQHDPQPADGAKVILADTDHLWGIGGDRAWVWKSFTRGLNPIYMDTFEFEQWRPSWAKFEACRRAMGDTLSYASRMNLATAVPRGDLASSRFCLASPDREYLVYTPFQAPEATKVRFSRVLGYPARHLLWQIKRPVSVDLSADTAEFAVEFFDPSSGKATRGQALRGGKRYTLTSPFRGDAVVYLYTSQAQQGNEQAVD